LNDWKAKANAAAADDSSDLIDQLLSDGNDGIVAENAANGFNCRRKC